MYRLPRQRSTSQVLEKINYNYTTNHYYNQVLDERKHYIYVRFEYFVRYYSY
jgi:hypothetical protein